MARVARAVHHAHERGVRHRDLKPGNIVLDASCEPSLTDFGMAKMTAADSGLTLTQAFLGTPEYMSPEQAAGHTRDIGPASDLWALGVVLFQMLSGRLPFVGGSVAKRAVRWCSGGSAHSGTDCAGGAHVCSGTSFSKWEL
jgi:eukaryotic-like serine/threonine-protein kinase